MTMLADAPSRTRILSVAEIRVDHPYDPAEPAAKRAQRDLTTSIIAGGLDLPIRVEFANGRYRVTDGRKRLAACADAGLTVVPAHVEDQS